MFNYQAIDKIPTVLQIIAIIKFMEDGPRVKYNFNHMMEMKRPKPNEIHLNLNNAHTGVTYKIIFSEDGAITSFEETGIWIS